MKKGHFTLMLLNLYNANLAWSLDTFNIAYLLDKFNILWVSMLGYFSVDLILSMRGGIHLFFSLLLCVTFVTKEK